jgi:hypothetical protein
VGLFLWEECDFVPLGTPPGGPFMHSKSRAKKLARLDHQKARAISGTVEAPNEKVAEAAAVAEFDLSDEQCRRLFVQERS